MERIDRIHKFLGEPEDRRQDVENVILDAFRAGVYFGEKDIIPNGQMPSHEKIVEALNEWRREEVSDSYVPRGR